MNIGAAEGIPMGAWHKNNSTPSTTFPFKPAMVLRGVCLISTVAMSFRIRLRARFQRSTKVIPPETLGLSKACQGDLGTAPTLLLLHLFYTIALTLALI